METGSKHSSKVCAKCGADISADAPAGLCSVCLFRAGLGPLETDDRDESSHLQLEFGDYDLLEELGRGGQGVVYRARQKSLNRTVALKVIGLGRWSSTPELKRFRHEAEAAAGLEHPQIVPIYEIGERDGSCYFSMKFVEGGQLDEVLKREPVSPRRAAELLAKIARTVQFAHDHGILHRDIKPGNILLDKNNEPHLTDFGLARLIEQESTVTNSFDVLGTPSYMPPEQAAGRAKELTPAADVYSLGAVFYHMLTGQSPFAGGTTYETIRMVLEAEPRNPRLWNPKIDLDLCTICLKCLEKDPAKRYPTAAALADDVGRWLRHEPIQARRTGLVRRVRKWVHRNPSITLFTASIASLLIVLGVVVWKSQLIQTAPMRGIAVLPFEDLSGEKSDGAFADGVQDDIVTKLAKIAALKVISRASVMQYRGTRNLPEIANALRVSYVLEGSVRRTPNRIHINTQLIDARTDTHVWAEEFDRDLIDTFAIQSEVAKKVAEHLHANITPVEQQSIERAPTADLTAYDLYTRAKNLFLRVSFSNSSREDLVQAANLLDQAVTRDPSFLRAYCLLALVHDYLYVVGHDHTAARFSLAESAVQSALLLQPDAGEAHLARADNLYRGHLDYDGALAELAIAQEQLPNEPRIYELRGYIERRQGKHEEALRSLERANELDPRNLFIINQIANSHILLQQFLDAKLALDRALAFDPQDLETKAASAWVDLEWKGDVGPLEQAVGAMRAANSLPLSKSADAKLICALARRDANAAKEALIESDQNTPLNDEAVHFSRSFVEGLIGRMTNDDSKARAAFAVARAEQQQIVNSEPNYAPPLFVLALIDAGLGRKDQALQEARHAVDLVPVEKDALNGPLATKYLAMTAAWTGDSDVACDRLAAALQQHSTISYGYLKLMPFWDPLRGDPRFEELVTSIAPK